MSKAETLAYVQKWFYAQPFSRKEELKQVYAGKRKKDPNYKETFWAYIEPVCFKEKQSKTSIPSTKSEDFQLGEETKRKAEETAIKSQDNKDEDTRKGTQEEVKKSPTKDFGAVVTALAIGALVFIAIKTEI